MHRKIDKLRLIDIKEKVIDCITNLEKTIQTMDKYKSMDEVVVEMCQGNFRECLELCVSQGFLSQAFITSFEPSIRLINKIAHGHKQPSTAVLIEYYKNNRLTYDEFLKSIYNTLEIITKTDKDLL